MMRDTEFCARILRLDPDWSVSEIEIDEPSNRIDITIIYGAAEKKSLFKRSQQTDAKSLTLRHLPIAGLRAFVHVPEPSEENGNKLWSPVGSKFTNEMEELALNAIKSARSIQGVVDTTGLTASDIREISERTGVAIERTASTPTEIPAEPIHVEETVSQSFDIAESSDVPLETHPNWNRLIDGGLPLQSNAVGLQMLLQRIRQEVSSSPTETTRLAGIRLLRQYFVKNQAQHKADIDVLNGAAVHTPGDKPALEVIQGGLPSEQHECWQRIISGQLNIETRHVSLQMMMERVRLSVQNSPTASNRLAGAKILRQFFLKHKRRLQPEIRQLGFEPAQTEKPASSGTGVPALNHPCWQRLINGELRIQTDAVGLQMMMERVRLSIQRNPSDSNRIAGIKILHQYFLKHQARHKAEIQALHGKVVTATSNESPGHTHIPAESHPSWQRLINGELEIMTDVVALKMMLERIRISVENNPNDATRMAGAKILRQYFIKHQHKHRAELDQLMAA